MHEIGSELDARGRQGTRHEEYAGGRLRVTADLRLNEGGYVKLPEIMKAKKKPLDTISLEDLGLSVAAQFAVLSTQPPSEREKGIVVNDVAELLASLKDKGLV